MASVHETQIPAKPYPYIRVILYFALLGGALGGGIVGFLAVSDMKDAGDQIFVAILFMMVGSVIGLIPATLCGIWLALLRTYRTVSGVLNATVSGALVSWLYGMAWILDNWDNWDNAWEILGKGIIHFLFLAPGGVSAFILSLCALPSEPQNEAELNASQESSEVR